MKLLIFLFVLSFLFLANCKNPYQVKQEELRNINIDTTNCITDTSINLTEITTSNYQGKNLTDSLAKTVLYKHFLKQGILSKSTGSLNEQALIETLFVHYDTIFVCNLNDNLYDDAIVSYWIAPWMASGHCWQPQKAILVDTDTGYTVLHEDFIPTNIAIDSVKNSCNRTILYAYDYDCGNHAVLKKMKIRIK